jgi:uncharacterized membrane protein
MKILRIILILTVLSLSLLFSSIPVSAQSMGGERIHEYSSIININEDASMNVTETITVTCERVEINHGIYRDFPVKYKDRYGNNVKVGFQVLSVERDGQPENYVIESLLNGKRVKIGSVDIFLDRGKTYTYTINYKTTRQMGFFEDYDEIYWNATGNGWGFNIDHATAEVHLPGMVERDKLGVYGYTGPYGSKGENYTAYVDENSVSHFETTAMLNAQEGFTVCVTFPKGIVAEPTKEEKARNLLMDNIAYIVGIAGFIVILIYYLIMWFMVGRDLPRGTVIPLFEPPASLPPSAVRYIAHMSYDNKVFAASLINLAVKGYLKIDEDRKHEYTLRKIKPLEGDDDPNLSDGEEVIFETLLPTSESIKLQNKNHFKISTAISKLREILSRNYQNLYFKTNSAYMTIGILLTLLTLAGMIFGVVSQSDEETMIVTLISVIFSSVGILIFVLVGLPELKTIVFGGGDRIKAFGSFIFGMIFLLAFCGMPILFGYFLGSAYNSIFLGLIGACLIGIHVVFYHLLKAPTAIGRKLLDQIAGFKMYLVYAEKDELDMMNPPERTPELFERYLPYALALDVENRWSEQFTDVLSAATQDKSGSAYHPVWYSGSHFSSTNFAGFASSIGGAVTSAVSSSATAPGSSSGGGGGGFSGGGGGGGGGGGW